jgi:DNA-binding FadR family transcriptional regulator
MRNRVTRNRTQALVEQLGQDIVSGVYSSPKGFPIEAELCEQLNASRSILREAVKMLTAKGLLGARPRHGTWVRPESEWNLLDPDVLRWLLERKFSLILLAEFTEVRLAIEPTAAALAAQLATPQSIRPIQLAIDRMRAAKAGNDDPLDSDIAFHVAVLHASGNRFFSQLEEFIDTALNISIQLTNRSKGVTFADVDDHERVLKAIVARDPNKARAAMEAILVEAMDLIAQAKSLPELPQSKNGPARKVSLKARR